MSTTFYDHWRHMQKNARRWPNFSPAEIACRGTGKLLVNEPALDKLQALCDPLDKPLIVQSAYRNLEHNRAVSGATCSKHLDGAAFDIAMMNHDPAEFESEAESGDGPMDRRPAELARGRVPRLRLLSALGLRAH